MKRERGPLSAAHRAAIKAGWARRRAAESRILPAHRVLFDDLSPFARACERLARKTLPGFPGLMTRWEGYIGYGPSSLADDAPGAVLSR